MSRLVAIALAAVSILLVAISPLVLDLFGGNAGSWARRGNIGQTYGAAAALLSVLALVGVGVSLVLQARESKANREQASRLIHTDLLKMAMDDPAYLECWGPYYSTDDPVETRQALYVNMIVSYWESRYELGQLTETHLREAAAHMFRAAPGRRFWADARSIRVGTVESRKARRFHRILDEEYLKAVTPGPSAVGEQSSIEQFSGKSELTDTSQWLPG
ncbi:DUF6082 family protein [Actinoallomurus sp. NPDC050550]|uniref:DUF6082 family protein n=1 Tax=Actinoallomurus sp. NPDC050550 TaxID=3154937 RepID=UPI0033FA8DCC